VSPCSAPATKSWASKAITALDPATAAMTDYEGAAKKAGDTLNDNTATSVEGFKRKASEMASDIAAKAIPHLEKLGRGFAGLPGPAQAAIAGLGGLAVAAGPISNTVDGVKNLATHAKSLGSSMVSVGTKMGSAASKATTLATNLGRTAASGAKSAIVGIGNAAKTAGTAALSGAKSLGAWALAAGKSAASAIASTASIVAQKVAMLAGKVATGIATAAQWLWNAALTANPIGLVIAAIVGIVAALVLAYNKVGWFKAFVDAAFRGISAVVGWVVNFIRNNWQTLLAILTGPIGLAVLFITKNWDTIKAGFGTVKAFIVGAISAIAGWFISKWQGIARVAQSIVDGLRSGWTKAKDWVISMVAKMVASIVGVKNRVTGSLGRVFDTLKSGATKARNFVTSMVARIVSTVVGIKNRVLSSLRAVFRPLTSAATTARNFVTSTVSPDRLDGCRDQEPGDRIARPGVRHAEEWRNEGQELGRRQGQRPRKPHYRDSPANRQHGVRHIRAVQVGVLPHRPILEQHRREALVHGALVGAGYRR
jgi:phage-related protein